MNHNESALHNFTHQALFHFRYATCSFWFETIFMNANLLGQVWSSGYFYLSHEVATHNLGIKSMHIKQVTNLNLNSTTQVTDNDAGTRTCCLCQ